jgi:hypothetical protein
MLFDAVAVIGSAFELVTEMAGNAMAGPGRTGEEPAYARLSATFREMGEPNRRTERTRWLEALHSEACFTAGVVVSGDDPLEVRPLEVVVTPTDLVLAGPDADGDGRPEELGRIGRDRVRTLEVLDAAGEPVGRPSGDPLEPTDVCRIAVTWDMGEGLRVDSFLFHAPSLAWETADRLERYRTES